MSDVKKILENAVANAEVENKRISEETIRYIEKCLQVENGSLLFQIYMNSRTDDFCENSVVEEAKHSMYCYDNGVLKNKYDQKNLYLLHFLETVTATYYQSKVVAGETNYRFDFTMESYLNLHKRLFSTVYEFAGQCREESIWKDCRPYLDTKTEFCKPFWIEDNLKFTLRNMAREVRNVQGREALVSYLAKYYCDLNAVHPFREGNGRTLRTYFLILVKELFPNYEVDYSLWDIEDRDLLLKYVIFDMKFLSDEGLKGVEMCFDKVVIEKEKKKVKSRINLG